MIKFDKNEFLKPQIYSTLDEYETRCNVTKEIIEEINQLQQENKILKENAEHNDKVVDKVNWENQLLKKENKKLNGTIQTYDILLKSNIEENKQLKDNWNKLKKYINEANEDLYWTNNYDDILYVMQELEGSDSNE